MSTYYLDHDGHGDLTMWNTHTEQPVLRRCDCTDDVWSLLLIGARLHEPCDGSWQCPAPTHIEGCLVHDTQEANAMSTPAEVAEAHMQNLLTGDADEVREKLRAVLTDHHPDPEQCSACDAVNDPCPYHRGVEAGYAAAMRQIGAYATRIGNNHDEREDFQNKEATR